MVIMKYLYQNMSRLLIPVLVAAALVSCMSKSGPADREFYPVRVSESYDYLIFIRHTTPSRLLTEQNR